jgi:hemolysin activation/secretion protein
LGGVAIDLPADFALDWIFLHSYKSHTLVKTVVLVLSAAWATLSDAQPRPDAGSLLAPKPPATSAEPPSAPQILLPSPTPAPPQNAALRMTPSAFRFTGNTLYPEPVLSALLADFVGQPTDLAGLAIAAAKVAGYYRSNGYLLTEAYLPEQTFAAVGGTVTIRVIEAKIGRAVVNMDSGEQAAARLFVKELVASHLKNGADVTEYLLDKPVLLLRDLPGHDASATVEPGDALGEVNVNVTTSTKGLYADGSVMLDNHGASAAGPVRVLASANLNNLMGRGDTLSVAGQVSDQPGSNLYRFGYVLPVGGQGMRLSINSARLNYALGKQFATLGATGRADLLGLGVAVPLIRSRNDNLYAQVNAEQKRLTDATTNPVQSSNREINALRLGMTGNFTDNLAAQLGLNSYGANITSGRLKLSPADLAVDQGAGGLQTAGVFSKVNLDYQRTQYLAGASSLNLIGQAQWASKNLGSAEKLSLGGPNGVRAYPVGEGAGDSGAHFSLEYRYPLQGLLPFSEPLSLVAFYDYGHVRLNQTGPAVPGAANSMSLGAVGVGAILGRSGNILIKTHLAWRTTRTPPPNGSTDAAARAWLTAQSWF